MILDVIRVLICRTAFDGESLAFGQLEGKNLLLPKAKSKPG
jgi:hypothetical protein